MLLQHVCGGINMDLIKKTASLFNLQTPNDDGMAETLLTQALESRRNMFDGCPADNLEKTIRTMYNNPLANLVWHLATLEMWHQGWHDSDRETQLVSFEIETKKYL